MHDPPRSIEIPPRLISYDGALGRQIIELHIWAVVRDCAAPRPPVVRRPLRAARHGRVPLWRAFAGMRTLHPNGAATVILVA